MADATTTEHLLDRAIKDGLLDGRHVLVGAFELVGPLQFDGPISEQPDRAPETCRRAHEADALEPR